MARARMSADQLRELLAQSSPDGLDTPLSKLADEAADENREITVTIFVSESYVYITETRESEG